MDTIEIFANCAAHYDQFVALNEAWIERYFALEEADVALARNPGTITDAGGTIFTAVLEGRVVGACALFCHGDDAYELARMAVDPPYQGWGIGRKLAATAIDRAQECGASKIMLLTNTVLSPAVTLYESIGFKIVREGPHPEYARCNLVMELAIESVA